MDRNMAVVGCGYWGKNLFRNLTEYGAIHTICHSNSAVPKKLEALYLSVNVILREKESEESLAVHG